MTSEFDAYVDEYADQHRRSIGLSGEDPAYFADYKVRELSRMCRDWRSPSSSVLDFGSGLGSSLPAFRKYFPASTITQADVSRESLKTARSLHGGDELQVLIEGGKLPVDDDQFDVVFTACVFHHIDHAEHISWLEELRRVTAPGGRLVVFEHNPWNPLTRHAVARCPFDVNAVLISAPTMRTRLARAGWVDPRTEYHIFFPAALAGLRPAEAWLRWCAAGAQYSCSGRAPS